MKVSTVAQNRHNTPYRDDLSHFLEVFVGKVKVVLSSCCPLPFSLTFSFSVCVIVGVVCLCSRETHLSIIILINSHYIRSIAISCAQHPVLGVFVLPVHFQGWQVFAY